MAKKDKEIRQIMQYRYDGMEYALNVAKTKGIDFLEKELMMRRMTFIPIELDVDWVSKIMRDVFSRISNSYKVMTYKTLAEVFGFGKGRLHVFEEEFNKNVEGIATVDNYGFMQYKFSDYAKIFNSERYEMKIDMDALLTVDSLNEENLESGKVVNEIIELLNNHEFYDASNFLREYMA